MRRALILVLITLATACGSDGTERAESQQPRATSSTAPSSPGEVVIVGTREYTFEETQSFGEFGPMLWGVVTTLNGTDDIPHGPGHEWVDWGPVWAGHQPDPGPYEVYGVTDFSTVDAEALADVVPAGMIIVIREVQWSLNELDEYRTILWKGAPDNGVCSTGFGVVPNRVRVVALPHLNTGYIPFEALSIEIVEECPLITH